MLTDHHRIAILTDGFSTPFLAKTAISLLRYRPQDIVAVIDQEHAGKRSCEVFGVGDVPVVSAWIPDLECDAIYIGIAPPGGSLPAAWRNQIVDVIQAGVDVVSGLHDFLGEDEQLVEASRVSSSNLVDVRRNRWKKTATGQPFSPGNLRIHAVGHDCSVGKMVTMLELTHALKQAGQQAKFLATGQTGIMISGQGIPADCIVADFINGAVEYLVRENEENDFLLIEGQGSISHPAFSAVTAGLLQGCAPQGLVFCYEAGREHVKGLDDVPIAPLEQQMNALLAMARLRGPSRFIGVAVNTRTMTPEESRAEIKEAEERFQLPACDVYRDGVEKLVAAALQLKKEYLG